MYLIESSAQLPLTTMATTTDDPTMTKAPKVFSLPNEVLENIFGFLKYEGLEDPPPEDSKIPSGVQDIKNARLACRTFYQNSSHLLIHTLRVDLAEPWTLTRLAEVSHCAAIRTGVKAIRVNIRLYSEQAASDLSFFRTSSSQNLRSYVRERDISHMQSRGSLGETYSLDDRILSLGNEALNLSRYFNVRSNNANGLGHQDSIKYQDFLREAFTEYGRRFREQQDLLESPTGFIHAVATAMKRFPVLNQLEINADWPKNINGHPFDTDKALVDEKSDLDTLLEVILEPLAADDWFHDTAEIAVRRTALSIKLIGGLYKAGITLKHLKIAGPFRGTDNLLNSILDSNIHNALGKLKTLEFAPSEEDESAVGYERENTAKDMATYVGALTCADGLTKLDLNFSSCDISGNMSLGLGTMLKPGSTWRSLTWVRLNKMSLHIAEIQDLLHRIVAPKVKIHLKSIHLLSGTWAEVLDLMAAKGNWECAYFSDLMGGEFDALENSNDIPAIRAFDGVFESEWVTAADAERQSDVTTPAESYVKGPYKENPARVVMEAIARRSAALTA